MSSFKNIGFLVVVIALIMFILHQCRQNKESIKQIETLNIYKTQATHYKDKATGLEVAYNSSLQLNKDMVKKVIEGNKALEALTKKYKDVSSIVTSKTVLRIDTLRAKLNGNPCDSTANFYIDSAHYYIEGIVSKKDIVINQININNEQSMVVGQLKRKLFKKKEYQVSVMNTNPYLHITNVGSYTFKPKIKFWQKKEVWGIAGIVLGIIIKK